MPKLPSYRNQSIDLFWKSTDWFLYDGNFGIQWVKIITPTRNDKFELPDGSYSVSDIQDYIEFIIKKHETLTTILPIHVYINRINNRLAFKLKDWYNLESQMPETMKLFGSTKKLIGKMKNAENAEKVQVLK